VIHRDVLAVNRPVEALLAAVSEAAFTQVVVGFDCVAISDPSDRVLLAHVALVRIVDLGRGHGVGIGYSYLYNCLT